MYESTAGAHGLCLASLRCSLCPVRFAGGKWSLSMDAPSEVMLVVVPPGVIAALLLPNLSNRLWVEVINGSC